MATAADIKTFDVRDGFPADRFVRIPDVPVFVEHETVLRKRKMHFGPKELAALAERCNRRIEETGDYVPLTIGHTPVPGEVKPDPEVVGFAGPFRLGRYQGKAAILADFHVFRDDVERLRKYPRRSPELWLEENIEDSYLDPIALLGAETPKLDMGLLLYTAERQGRIVERYTAVAPSATDVFIPEHFEQEDHAMAFSPEDIQQIVQALEQLDWVKWIKEKMAAEASAASQDDPHQYDENGQPSDKIDPEKAKQILEDGEIDGKPLTEDQRKMFAAAASRQPDKSSRTDAGQQPERYQQLEAELVRLRRDLDSERNSRKNAERYAQLYSLREQFQFDLEREMERCRAEKMSDDGFTDHVAVIQENYQRIPVGHAMPPAIHAGKPHADKERYEKELHDRARKICERRATRGQQVDYMEVVEQLRAGKEPD